MASLKVMAFVGIVGLVPGLCGLAHAQEIEIPAGGLMFVNDPAIAIQSLEVAVGPERIRMAYTLRNTLNVPRAIVVAFPLPDLDAAAIGEERVAVPAAQSDNYVAATFTANDVPVAAELQQRALVLGLDATSVLVETQLPLVPVRKGVRERLAKLAPIVKSDLQQRGIARLDGDRIDPNWTLKTTAYWLQPFEANEVITIKLAYQPIVAQIPLTQAFLAPLRDDYCLSGQDGATVAGRAAVAGAKARVTTLGYLASSTGTLPNAIANFRLHIEKPEMETVVATCWRDLKQPGPTVLEWTATDYYPDQDLRIAFIR